MLSEPIEITLVRHGESTFNAQGLYQGASDLPRLTPSGRAQAAVAAGQLIGSYDEIWVSPLSRALETAEILACARPLPDAQILDELREIDLPEWEGQPFSAIKQQQQDRHQTWKFEPSRFLMTGQSGTPHNPAEDITARARFVLDKARRLAAGSRLLLVTHSGFIRASIIAALGINIDQLHAARIDNCALTKLSLFADGTAQLKAFNQTSAWPHGPKLTQDIPAIFVTGLEALSTMSELFPNARPYALDGKTSDLTATRLSTGSGTSSSTVLAYGSQDMVAQFFNQFFGLSESSKGTVSLDPQGMHILLPKGASDPARLWHLNLSLPRLMKPIMAAYQTTKSKEEEVS